jgi:hypothetical protein
MCMSVLLVAPCLREATLLVLLVACAVLPSSLMLSPAGVGAYSISYSTTAMCA